MHWISALLLGLATNIDNLLIGMLLGLEKKKIKWWQNAVIALGAFLAALLCCLFSEWLVSAGRLPSLLGALLLLLLGVHTLVQSRKSAAGTPGAGAGGNVPMRGLGIHECLYLTLTLGVNVVAAAFGAGMTGMSAWVVSLSVAGFSFATVGIGNALGCRSGRLPLKEKSLNVLSACAMILLGVLELAI